MENFPSESDLKNLVKELSQGRELAQQLQIHLNAQSSSSHESREFLLQRILYSYDQALSMLITPARPSGGAGEVPPPPPPPPILDSPRSFAGSPHSDDSDQDHKDQASRKRNKGVARWSAKIKVRPEAGIEGQLDDGYNWRKYGQKDILGAKYPRGYYRCTYRHSQGCLAAKQVQRSDDDPTIIEITYKRKHTCNPPRPINNPPDPQKEDPNPSSSSSTQRNLEPLFGIQTSLRVITPTGPDDKPPLVIPAPPPPPPPPPFNFPNSSSSPLSPQNINHMIFSDTNASNNLFGNYYPISTNDIEDYGYGGLNLIPNPNPESHELSQIVAAITRTSTANSTTLDAPDFPLGSSGFGSDFSFNADPGRYRPN